MARPPAVPKAPYLLRRVAGAASFRVKESRAAKAAIGTTTAAHQSLETFANRTELDRDIAKSVRGLGIGVNAAGTNPARLGLNRRYAQESTSRRKRSIPGIC